MIVGREDSPKKQEENFFADLNLYSSMAHFVAKQLHMRPGEILDTWGVPELIVAYGEYSNEITHKNHEQWKALPPETRAKTECPPKYHVKFISKVE